MRRRREEDVAKGRAEGACGVAGRRTWLRGGRRGRRVLGPGEWVGRAGLDGGGWGAGYWAGLRVWGYMLGTSGASPNVCDRFGVKNARSEEISGQKKRGSGQKRRGSGQKVHFGGQKAKFAGQKKIHHAKKRGCLAKTRRLW